MTTVAVRRILVMPTVALTTFAFTLAVFYLVSHLAFRWGWLSVLTGCGLLCFAVHRRRETWPAAIRQPAYAACAGALGGLLYTSQLMFWLVLAGLVGGVD